MRNIVFLSGVMLLAVSLMAASCSKQPEASLENDAPATSVPVIPVVPTIPVVDDSATIKDEDVANQTVLVRYFDSGFLPFTVTINQGDTVMFVNNSSGDFWPASNPHPIHTGLSGFDAKKPIDIGGSYGFSFNRVGTFRYHNHLLPAQGGTIIVK